MNEPSQITDSESKAIMDLIADIARALVDDSTSVSVKALHDQENTVLRLRVAPSDIGKMIGKQGRTARSLRTILGAASMKMKHRFTLDILEQDTSADI